MKKQKSEVILKEELFISKGTSRKSYIHPDDENVCIKISHKKSSHRSTQREIKYYQRLQKRHISFDMISKYLYSVQTNQGRGDAFELVRDYDGHISKDLRFYLSLKNDRLNHIIAKLLEDLRQYLKREYILFSDLDFRNILVKRVTEDEYKLIIIDGLGDNNQVPLLEYVHWLGERRSIKKWERFRLRWIKEFPYLEEKVKSFEENN